MTSRPWAHLSDGAGQIIGKSHAVRDSYCHIRNRHRERLGAHDAHYAIAHHSSADTCPWCQGRTCGFTASHKVDLGATVGTL
jgi:hypothetical protein